MWSALPPTICLVYLCRNVGPEGLLPTALPAQFSARLSPALSAYLCVNVGLQGLLVFRLPALFIPHSAILSPLGPSCQSLPLLLVWMNVYFLSPWCQTSLPFDFLSVLVVPGGAVCLPTLPSWFASIDFLILTSPFIPGINPTCSWYFTLFPCFRLSSLVYC